MDLHTALLTAALHWLTLPHSSALEQPRYVKWCGPSEVCEAMVEQAVEDIEYVSILTDTDPFLMLSLAMAESRLNPRAKSSIGAFGLFQVNPRVPVGAEVLSACRSLSQRECDRLAALRGAMMFAAGVEKCHGLRAGVYNHRTGHCGLGPNSSRVVDKANRMRKYYAKSQMFEVDWVHGKQVYQEHSHGSQANGRSSGERSVRLQRHHRRNQKDDASGPAPGRARKHGGVRRT